MNLEFPHEEHAHKKLQRLKKQLELLDKVKKNYIVVLKKK